MQKGLEMPINMIIVIAIAVLVLVAIFGFFGGQFFSGSDQISSQKLFADGCAVLRNSHSCDQAKINMITIGGKSFGSVCNGNGFSDTAQCAKACGCAVPQGEKGQALQNAPSSQLNKGQTSQNTGQNSQTPKFGFQIVGVNIFGE